MRPVPCVDNDPHWRGARFDACRAPASYEYAIVVAKQPDPATATALREFLLWAIGAGEGNNQKALDPLHFVTLPEYVRALSDAQIRKIE